VHDRNEAAHKAALLVSDQLAETTRALEPPEIETFELGEVQESLPRVVYILCQHSPEHHAGSVRGWGDHLYGITRLHPPWVIHPNELLDGALCFGDSWRFVNDPLVLELYRRHGVDLNFVGCIVIRTRWSSQAEKDVTSQQAAKVARMLGARGVVVVGFVGGNDFMEAVRTAQACELEGLKTVFVVHEEEPSEGAPPILEPLPEVQAIVSTGLGRAELDPSPVAGVERVIGDPELTLDLSTGRGKASAYGELPWYRSGLGHGGLDSHTSCFEY
jgi:glycine reductase